MKKTTLLVLALFAWVWQTNAQTLNEAANWPNTNWTLNVIEHTGSGAQDIEADPTAVANFAYDDDDTGSGSHDVIAAESPVIDLTAASTAGENFIKVAGDYVYNNIDNDEYLAIEYYDADTATWALWYQFPNQDTSGAPTNNFCSGTPESYISDALDISGFTATQLSEFKYRFIYNDDTTGGNGYNWGFCFSSPTISSNSNNYTIPVFDLTVTDDCANNQFSVAVNVTDLGGASAVNVSDDQGSASQQLTATGTVNFGPYPTNVAVNITVTNNDDNNYTTSLHAFTGCAPTNDECDNPISLTVNPDLNCTNVTQGNTVAATASPQTDDVTGTPDNDVWFTFIATNTDHRISLLNVTATVGSSTDMGMGLYSGDCNNLTLVQDSDPNTMNVSGLTVGDTYILRVYGWSSGASSAQATFDVCVGTPPLPVANDTMAGAIPITPSPAGTGCSTFTFQAWTTSETVTDSGLDGSCNGSNTGMDVFYTWTATSDGLLWNDGDGNPGIVIRDTSGNEITCAGTYASDDTVLSGWNVGDDLIIQIYDYAGSLSDVSFCLEEYSLPPAPDCVSNPTPADGATVTVESGRKVVLNWDAATSGPAATQYKIEIGTTAGGPYDISATLDATNVPPVNFLNALDATTYYWKVTPINNGVEASGCAEWSFITQYPAAIANDSCATAAILNVDPDACVSPTLADNSFATDSGETAPSCGNYQGSDLWYTVTVPASGHLFIETSEVSGSYLTDTGLAVYSGSCGSLTELTCNDDFGGTAFSQVELTGQTPGDVLYVRVYEYGNNSFGEFNICAWDPDASSVEDNQIAGFKFYPNPVNNTLTLSAQDNIDNVSIFNVAGQQVLYVKPETTQTQIDMSKLQNGIYFVKAQINGELTAFKVVKK